MSSWKDSYHQSVNKREIRVARRKWGYVSCRALFAVVPLVFKEIMYINMLELLNSCRNALRKYVNSPEVACWSLEWYASPSRTVLGKSALGKKTLYPNKICSWNRTLEWSTSFEI